MSKFKRYERYKDSGVEWIGEVPEHWSVIKLKYVAKLAYGDSLPTENREEEGEVDVFGSNGKVGTHNVANTLSPVIIVGRKGSYGKVTYSDKKCFAIDTTYYIDNRCTKSNIKWLYHSLMILELDKNSQDTGVPGLSREYAYNKYVPVPTVNEQAAIANFLEQKTAEIDGLIADKEKLIELLQEKRQAIITEAVTKGLNPNVKMKDSGIEWIGEIPEHWRLSKIKYESLINNKTLSESTDDDYEIDYIDISSVTSIGEIDGVQSLNFKDAPSRARRILSKGDTIVSTVRTYLKAIAFIENTQSNLICSTGFAVLTPLSKVVPKYLFYLMRSEKYVNEIVRRSVGVSYPAVNASDIGDLECALPDRDEQMYIVEYLDNCTTQINQLVNNIQAQIQKLKEYRQSLISEAVTGKIDVREFGSIREVI
jgi:type I restriction enzyme S subunit